MLQTEADSEHGASFLEPIVKTRRLQWSGGKQFFIGIGNQKSARVVLDRTLGAVIEGGISQKRATSIPETSMLGSPAINHSAMLRPTPPPWQNPAITPTATQ